MSHNLANILKLMLLIAVLALYFSPLHGFTLEKPETELTQAGITTQLATQIELDLPFTSSTGEKRDLRDFMRRGRPAIVVPVYYSCARMCGLTLNGLSKTLNEIDLKIGDDFEVITISFDATEGVDLASERAELYHTQHKTPQQAMQGWHFLVGEQANVDLIMQQLGFHYLEDKGEFAHAAAIMLLTPTGQISQYFTGIEFSAKDLRLALVEASQGRIGDVIDQFLLFCFRFDQSKGKYTWAAFATMRVGGAITLVLLGGLLLYLWRREKRPRIRG